jgi:hypothetical protein
MLPNYPILNSFSRSRQCNLPSLARNTARIPSAPPRGAAAVEGTLAILAQRASRATALLKGVDGFAGDEGFVFGRDGWGGFRRGGGSREGGGAEGGEEDGKGLHFVRDSGWFGLSGVGDEVVMKREDDVIELG